MAISAQERGATITDGFLPRVVISKLDTNNDIIDYHIVGDDIDGIAGLQAGQWFGKSLASLANHRLAVGIPGYRYYGYYEGVAYDASHPNLVAP